MCGDFAGREKMLSHHKVFLLKVIFDLLDYENAFLPDLLTCHLFPFSSPWLLGVGGQAPRCGERSSNHAVCSAVINDSFFRGKTNGVSTTIIMKERTSWLRLLAGVARTNQRSLRYHFR